MIANFDPQMVRFDIQEWVLACDVEATRRIYAQITEGGANECVCDYCKNYALLRARVFPEPARALLAQLGIDWRREAEVMHYNREESGLHFYGGWFHFVGHIESRGTQFKIAEDFSIDFGERYAPMFAQFKDEPTVRIDFSTHLPWVLENE